MGDLNLKNNLKSCTFSDEYGKQYVRNWEEKVWDEKYYFFRLGANDISKVTCLLTRGTCDWDLWSFCQNYTLEITNL